MDFQQIFSPLNLTLAILLISSLFFMRGKVRSDLVALCSFLTMFLSNTAMGVVMISALHAIFSRHATSAGVKSSYLCASLRGSSI